MPGGGLREGEFGIEKGEKLCVIEFIGVRSSFAEGPACQVSQFVVGSSNAPRCQGGGFCDDMPECQGPDQALSHDGLG